LNNEISLAVRLHPFRQVAPFIPCSLSLFGHISIALRGKQETDNLPPRKILDYPSFIARKWLTATVELRKTGFIFVLCVLSRDLDWIKCLDYAKSYVICLCVSMKTCVENNVLFWSKWNNVHWLQPASDIKHLHGDKMDGRSDVKLDAMEAKLAVTGKAFF
jgi:hypothetical protein